MSIEIISTKDGSHSLLNTELRETYHSVHGALQESMHVFIKHGLVFFSVHHPTGRINVLEVGFGTGLNALLALKFAQRTFRDVHFTSLEASPLDRSIWERLNYGELLSDQHHFTMMHELPWGIEAALDPNFKLLKIHVMIQNIVWDRETFDVVFFDAFAPGVQPEIWELPVIRKVQAAMKHDGVFVTYSSRGQLKRDLRSISFQVESLPGPPGKKEMTRALKI